MIYYCNSTTGCDDEWCVCVNVCLPVFSFASTAIIFGVLHAPFPRHSPHTISDTAVSPSAYPSVFVLFCAQSIALKPLTTILLIAVS
jgi:hypothetical protein